MNSPRSPEVLYASVIKGYSSPSEKQTEYQTQEDEEATTIALAESLNDARQGEVYCYIYREHEKRVRVSYSVFFYYFRLVK